MRAHLAVAAWRVCSTVIRMFSVPRRSKLRATLAPKTDIFLACHTQVGDTHTRTHVPPAAKPLCLLLSTAHDHSFDIIQFNNNLQAVHTPTRLRAGKHREGGFETALFSRQGRMRNSWLETDGGTWVGQVKSSQGTNSRPPEWQLRELRVT